MQIVEILPLNKETECMKLDNKARLNHTLPKISHGKYKNRLPWWLRG